MFFVQIRLYQNVLGLVFDCVTGSANGDAKGMKKITGQLIFRTFYVTAVVLTYFQTMCGQHFRWNPEMLLYYTHLSNYMCAGFMTVLLVCTAKRLQNGCIKDRLGVAPHFHLVCTVALFLTFAVANTLLEQPWTAQYWKELSFASFIMHAVCPLCFVTDWLCNIRHGRLKWWSPLLCLLFPLAYGGVILLRGNLIARGVIRKGKGVFYYPYDFMDVSSYGPEKVLKNCLLLMAGVLTVGYLFLAVDRLLAKKQNRQMQKV